MYLSQDFVAFSELLDQKNSLGPKRKGGDRVLERRLFG
jgi:hypothetical protein